MTIHVSDWASFLVWKDPTTSMQAMSMWAGIFSGICFHHWKYLVWHLEIFSLIIGNIFLFQGYHKRRAYVATQGPLPDTTDDFWRMMWENKSATIVMLTKEREGGRSKCHRYWPSTGAKTFGQFQVVLHVVNEYPDYTLRELKLVDTRVKSCSVKRNLPSFYLHPLPPPLQTTPLGWLISASEAVPVHGLAWGGGAREWLWAHRSHWTGAEVAEELWR